MPQRQDVLLDRLGQRKFAGLGLVWKEQCPRFGAVPHCGTTGFHQPVRQTNVFVDQLAKILTGPEFFGPLPGEQSNRPRTVVGVDFLEIRRQRVHLSTGAHRLFQFQSELDKALHPSSPSLVARWSPRTKLSSPSNSRRYREKASVDPWVTPTRLALLLRTMLSSPSQSAWSLKMNPRSTPRQRWRPRTAIHPEANAVSMPSFPENLRIQGVPAAEGGHTMMPWPCSSVAVSRPARMVSGSLIPAARYTSVGPTNAP